ncbi:hypothetical protein [Sphingobium sp. MK2]|uniref:hypothetical protein n=1 Tax=Sphingobium sp. MK2 TaxID=3116540 RepID=UPI0032E36108
MARAKRQLIGKWNNDDGDTVWVYKAGRSFWISYGDGDHLCHPSIRNVSDTKREALIVFNINAPNFVSIG